MKRKDCIVQKTRPHKCIACNGSGYYDNRTASGKSAKCSFCDGSGIKPQR